MKKYIIGLTVGIVLSSVYFGFVGNGSEKTKEKELSVSPTESEYPFLARRIFLENPNDVIVNFIDLRTKLRNYEETSKEEIGIYFEYLPTGVHIGINDREEFYRASLIKLPLVMRAYKMMEEEKISKNESLVVRRDLLDNTYGSLWQTGAGTSLGLSEIIRLILIESDNTAHNMLLDRVNQVLKDPVRDNEKGIDEVYDYFDIPKVENGKTLSITPRSYASILKSLFFSSYLDYKSSSEILNIMTESKFDDYMPSGIPKEIKIAHKIGVYNADSEVNSVHSDCGIVYQPKRPYIMCIMIKSSDQKISLSHINKISEIVYDYVLNSNKKK